MLRSPLTQQLQNYFDINDSRVRNAQNSLDAQLLNAAATCMEEHNLRFQRELNARYISTCPLNIDNRGVYYKLQLPPGFVLPTDADGNSLPPQTVIGTKNQVQTTLTLFSDLLPTPNSIEKDPDRNSVSLSSPLMATITADASTPSFSAPLAIPNRLTFWLQDLGTNISTVTIIIEGEPYPRSLWPGQQTVKSECITVNSEGTFRSKIVWYSVSRIRVYGLPKKAHLGVYSLEMNLPFVADPSRPFTHPSDRDSLYSRFWSISDGALDEVYYENPDLGFVSGETPLISSYLTNGSLNSICLEPNTYGMFAVQEASAPGSSPTLFYADRREPMPGSLDQAALTAVPAYGLQVDFSKDPIRQVTLTPQPYSETPGVANHRFLVQLPSGQVLIYYYDTNAAAWVLRSYSSSFWVAGAPPATVNFALGAPGTYVFSLETRDGSGTVLRDAYPFQHLAFTPQQSFPLVDLAHALGIGFDYKQQLWIWDGFFLHPYRTRYEGYIFDPDGRALYLTDNFDEVQVQ